MPVLDAGRSPFDIHVPAVVVGAGACGLTAALTLADAGVGVLVLERDANPTGNTALSAGLIPAAGSRLQREKGVPDTPEIFAADIAAKARHQNDARVVHAVTAISGPTIDWLMDRHGLELHLVEGFRYPGHSQLRMHGPRSQTGADLQQMLLAAARRAGVDVLTSASVEDIYAERDGTVRGVRFVRPDGSTETVGCDVLILACNGFGANPAMVREYIPEMSEATYCGHESNTGDAVRWGQALGAGLADLGAYQGHGSVPSPHRSPLTWAVISLGGFQVNTDGRRFANEMSGYSEHAREVLRQPGGIAWNIYDVRCEAPALAFQDYQQMQAVGAIRQTDSVESLAQVTGVPLAALRETLDHAAACARGEASDPLGRDFTMNPPLQPPYRAARVTGALFHTQGGLVVDTEARVLRADGTALPNLFAGGGAARGLCGPAAWGYMSGNGLLSAVMLGRLAALAASRQVAG